MKSFPFSQILMITLGVTSSAFGADAESLYAGKDYGGAYESYESRLAEKNPHGDKLEYGAGTAAYKEENYAKAAEHLGRAILTEDDDLRGKAYYNLGNTLFQLGKVSEEREEIIEQWEAATDHYKEAEQLGGSVSAN
ncbi:MAG: hypothetical protein ACKVHP_23620, partial [Verrucomicrobiales bacterium]